MKPILAVKHLCVSFSRCEPGQGTLTPVADLSLTVEPGQVAAVVGNSGSGKSLLAHAILGVLPRNAQVSGQIVYDGAPLTARRAEALRGRELALIPQGVTYLDPMLRVGPQIRRGRRDAASRRRCREALERYGLGPETEELYPFQLSGGMARRVLIAAAVADGPRLIVADEPTPGLDLRTAGRVLGHFRELAGQGAGVLFITHDLRLALSVADKLAVLRDGRTVEELTAAQFQSGEGGPYARALWRAMPENEFRASGHTQATQHP